MKNKSICKFPIAVFSGNPLSISCFVKETDFKVMSKHITVKKNRMLLVTEGQAAICVDGDSFEVSRGMLVFVFADENFHFENIENLTYVYIEFLGIRGGELLRQFHVTALSRVFSNCDALIPFWQECLFRASEQTVDLVAESVLLYSFSRLYDNSSRDNGLLGKIIEITEQNFKDPELSISEIASELSYNSKYLSHFFKERSGVGYSEFLRSVRLKYAVSLFDHGLDSIKNVALLSGFSDPLYFSNVFKKNIGLSPKAYIKKAGNSNASEPKQ